MRRVESDPLSRLSAAMPDLDLPPIMSEGESNELGRRISCFFSKRNKHGGCFHFFCTHIFFWKRFEPPARENQCFFETSDIMSRSGFTFSFLVLNKLRDKARHGIAGNPIDLEIRMLTP